MMRVGSWGEGRERYGTILNVTFLPTVLPKDVALPVSIELDLPRLMVVVVA